MWFRIHQRARSITKLETSERDICNCCRLGALYIHQLLVLHCFEHCVGWWRCACAGIVVIVELAGLVVVLAWSVQLL